MVAKHKYQLLHEKLKSFLKNGERGREGKGETTYLNSKFQTPLLEQDHYCQSWILLSWGSGLGATMAHQLKVERSKSCGQLFPLSKGFYRNLLWWTFLPRRIFLGSGLPALEGQLCSQGALRYQRAAGEMAGHNLAFRCREPTEQKACNLSMQLQKRRCGRLTPVKVKKAKSEEIENTVSKSEKQNFFIC